MVAGEDDPLDLLALVSLGDEVAAEQLQPIDGVRRAADVLHGDNDQQAEKQHEADHVHKPFALRADAPAAQGFDRDKEQPPTVQRGQGKQVGDRKGCA